MRRPGFGSLNPAESLTVVGNVFLINNGTRGNPDLRPQKSDSIDLTAEYYFDSGYVAVTGYYRSIKDRVVTSNRQEEIAGENYQIGRAHVCTPVTNAHLVCRLLLEKKKK